MDTYLLNITKLNSAFMDRARDVNATGMKVLLDELDTYDPAHAEWQLAYSHKSLYGLGDFSPGSFAKLIDRMRDDDELLGRYYRLADSLATDANLLSAVDSRTAR